MKARHCLPFVLGLFATQHCVAQLVEVTAEIETISWQLKDAAGNPMENHRSYSARCVVGTNTWLIETDFLRGAKDTWWFVGTNIAKHRVITKEVPERREQRKIGVPFLTTPHVGQRFTTVVESVDGHPDGDMGVKVPWLAFCSGSYLKREGRQIPLPGTVDDRDAFGYSDETSVFDDSFGLPKRVALHAHDRHLKCEYQVQESTNVLGWSFPSKFSLVQYRPDRNGQWERYLAASGRVTSIGERTKMQIPAEVQNGPEK